MAGRKQALLQQHRRHKRMVLIGALIVLALLGVLLAWWLVPLLLLLGWVVHEAWFADHLFYRPADDYHYVFTDDAAVIPGRIDAGHVLLEGGVGSAETLILQAHIKASWLGRWFDPYVLIGG